MIKSAIDGKNGILWIISLDDSNTKPHVLLTDSALGAVDLLDL